ncbi:MAG: ABC transporter ATP-binding protein [Oscillibacter sp.]|nr:ABC transporter ATP-binding protein [Oscillibacter sp.]MBD5170277.1 ABC transporter ATP-binding protein [Oscillibacter sp.]
MNHILEFKDVSYAYKSPAETVSILEGASAVFEEGKLYAIVGPSGSGKTTTLTLAGALEAPASGDILYRGKDIREIGYSNYRNRNIGFVFQAYNLLTYLTPFQNVMTAMEITKNNIPNKKERAVELLSRMGITKEQMNRNVNRLSGGEQQRVAIARALSTKADVILADEPTGNLDEDTAAGIMNIFQELAGEGKCVIAVTHSAEFAEKADIVYRLERHKLVQMQN